MRALVAFVRLARPLFLGGGFIGFALGAVVARFDGYPLSFGAYVAGQATVTAFQLMVHFANDYYDRAGDALAQRTLFSGGSGVLLAGELSPRVALLAALGCAGLGAAIVLRAALAGELVTALVGALIGVLAWCYSAPPLRLSARGLGEIDTIAVVALLVPLAGYVAFAQRIAPHALEACVPGACAMFAMMLCVELPDASADAACGKRNLVVRWGPARALALARWSAAGAIAALPAIAVAGFGIAAALAATAAFVPALVALVLALQPPETRTPAVPPVLGVLLYATTALAALVLIASAAYSPTRPA